MGRPRVLFHPESLGGQGPMGPRPAGPGTGPADPEPVVLDEEEVMPVAVTPPPRVGPAAVRPAGGTSQAGARPAGIGGAPPVFQPGTRTGPAGVPQPTGDGDPPPEPAPKIRAMDQRLSGASARHEDSWKRSPNLTGQGAIHCKSFHCKLTGDSLENIDRQINEWLDAHPQYEVKFVTATVGEWLGKLKEPNLILQVWV